jgi:hypothetical protein
LNGATEAYVILHEVAHFGLAPPERRELVEFGPGASPDTLDCSAAERTTVLSLERDADEAAASLLGHCLRVGSGSRRSLRSSIRIGSKGSTDRR